MSELKPSFIHALLPLQLGMATCYQCESDCFPVPYAAAAFQTLWPKVESYLYLRGFQTQQLGLAIGHPILPQYYIRIDLRGSESSWRGIPPDSLSKHATCALIVILEPPLFKILDPPLRPFLFPEQRQSHIEYE